MTTKEQKLFDDLQRTINEFRESNRKLAVSISERVEKIEVSMQKKNEPIFLENDIMQATKQAIGKAISESLNRYRSPLEKLCGVVIGKHEDELKQIVETSIVSVFRDNKFVDYLNEELAHKAARILADSSKGICDSVIGELKNDNVFRARLTVVVSDLIKNHQNYVQTT